MSTPRLVIGVTGHRRLPDIAAVEAGVDQALDELTRRYQCHAFTVVSALADGADRLVARRVMARPDARLIAVLPLPVDQYADDFADERSRAEFAALMASADAIIDLPPQAERPAAYEAAGIAVLSRADVLLAVWDGGVGEGRGGTADIVGRARARGVALAWVHLSGDVTFENLPAAR